MITIQAVIFDMDGVLVNSEPHHVAIEKKLFQKLQLDISDKGHASYMGRATDVMWREIISTKNLSLDLEEIVQLNYDACKSYFSGLKELHPMPELIPLLEKIKTVGVPMSVASSSDMGTIEIIMQKSGLRDYFQHVVSSGLVGRSKPEPDVFLHTAKLMRVPPENCIVVEDSTNGIKAAKLAGMFCVAYTSAPAGEQNYDLADMSINNYSSLEGLLPGKPFQAFLIGNEKRNC